MRLFLQGNLASRLMEGSMQEGEELEHPWLNRSIESAQKKVEQQNFSIRKRLLQYDDVLNQQREVVYGIRNARHPRRAAQGHHLRAGRGGARSSGWRSPGSARRAAPTPRRSRAWSAGSTRTSRSACSVRGADGDRPGAARQAWSWSGSAGLRGQGVGGDARGPRRPRALRGHQRDRPPLAGAPDGDGGAAPLDRPAQLRPEGSPGRIQGRGLHITSRS